MAEGNITKFYEEYLVYWNFEIILHAYSGNYETLWLWEFLFLCMSYTDFRENHFENPFFSVSVCAIRVPKNMATHVSQGYSLL